MAVLSIKSASSGRYLDGRNPGMSDPCLSSGQRQPASDRFLQWIIRDAGNGHVFIKSVSSGQYLDGRNPGMSNPCLSSGERNPTSDVYLQWIIGDAGNGHVFIKSVSSGQYFDGRNPGMSDPCLSSGERNPTSDVFLQWEIEDILVCQHSPHLKSDTITRDAAWFSSPRQDTVKRDAARLASRAQITKDKLGPQRIPPAQIKTTQKTVNGGVNAMIANMKGANNFGGGCKDSSDYAREGVEMPKKRGVRHEPVDVIQRADGSFQTLDNKRVVAANNAGQPVPIIIHQPNDPLPSDQLGRFEPNRDGRKKGFTESATTWGEAADIRIANQGKNMPKHGLEPSQVKADSDKFPSGKSNYNKTVLKLENQAKRLEGKYGPKSHRAKFACTAAGAGVEAGVWVADHHMYKNAKVDMVEEMVAPAARHIGESGEAYSMGPRASAYHIRGDYGVKVGAGASTWHGRAQSEGIPGTGGLFAAYAEAEAPNAKSQAEASSLGVKASAKASVFHASTGFDGSPAQASVSGPTTGASAGIHANHIGASVEASVVEAAAGPFAVRVGAKFGGGVENGIPVVHLGPVSTPCCIM